MRKKLTTKDFILKAQKIHKYTDGTPFFNYDKSNYTGFKIPIIITCPEHGDFEQTPASHLQHRNGCQKCAQMERLKTQKYSKDIFVSKAILIHKNIDNTQKYDYSKSIYIHSRTKLIITCPEHGDFEQTPASHLQGNGCPKCAQKLNSENNLLTTKFFIDKAILIHKNIDNTQKYDYSKSIYTGTKNKLIITCPIHGDFEQIPNNHLTGSGCPLCIRNISKSELEIQEFISSLNIEFEISNRYILSDNKELDIFIPSKNVAIEFNGLYWHNELHKSNNYHLQKTKECQEKGIRLIHVFEDEWIIKQGIVKSRLSNILGVTQFHTYARKCTLRNISSSEAKLFLDKHHIQGYCNSSIQIGLFQKDKTSCSYDVWFFT